MRKASHRGFTLVEVIVALAVGIVVVGAACALLISGNRQFATVTEHSSFREEAMLCLEKIAKDMDQIVVSTGMKPNGKYHLTEPYELRETYTQTTIDPVTKQPVPYTEAGRVITLWIYHHTEMAPDAQGVPRPTVVGQKVDWETRLVSPGDPSRGVDLFRNGEKQNRMALSTIEFLREPTIVAAKQIGGSPNAILTVTVVPKGGMWGRMTRETLQNLRADGSVVSRTFHLSGYESLYTTVLYQGIQQLARNQKPEGLIAALVADADTKSKDLFKSLTDGRKNRGAAGNALPESAVRIEYEKVWDAATAYSDTTWNKAKVVPFKPEVGEAPTSNGTLALGPKKLK